MTYLQGSPTQLETPFEQADNSGNYNWDIIDETTEYELLFRQIGSIQPYYTPDAKFHPVADNSTVRAARSGAMPGTSSSTALSTTRTSCRTRRRPIRT